MTSLFAEPSARYRRALDGEQASLLAAPTEAPEYEPIEEEPAPAEAAELAGAPELTPDAAAEVDLENLAEDGPAH